MRWFVLVMIAFLTSGAHAAWPEQSVTLVVPYPPGGPIDQIGRQLAQRLQQATGKPFVVDNRSGAGGTIGSQQVLHAAADGHTLLLATTSSQVTVPQGMRKAPYDGASDFTPITTLVRYPFLLVGKPNGPATVNELIAAGKRKELNYGSFGIGAGNHLIASYFAQRTGIRALHVPYRGSGATSAALMSGEIDFVFDSVQAVSGLISDGKLRAIAISSATRSSALPSVPTLQESGIVGFDEVIWVGLLGPKGIPLDVVQRINKETNEFLADAAFRKRMESQGATMMGGTADAFRSLVKSDQQRWSRFMKENNIEIE